MRWEAEADRAVTCHTKALRHPQQGHGARLAFLTDALPRPSRQSAACSKTMAVLFQARHCKLDLSEQALRWLPILLKVNPRPGAPSNLPAPFLSACFCCSCLVLLSRHTCFSSSQTARLPRLSPPCTLFPQTPAKLTTTSLKPCFKYYFNQTYPNNIMCKLATRTPLPAPSPPSRSPLSRVLCCNCTYFQSHYIIFFYSFSIVCLPLVEGKLHRTKTISPAFAHRYVPSAQNNVWHTGGPQEIFMGWMNFQSP